MHEISSAAISLTVESEISFEDVAKATVEYLEEAMKTKPHNGFFYNINFPKNFKDGKAQFQMAKLGHRDYINAFQQRTDEHGRNFFRVGGQVYDIDRSEGTDIYAAEAGYAAVTPLHTDLTDYAALKD